MMSGLNKTINQLHIGNSVNLYGHVLRREDGHVLTRAFEFQVEIRRE